MNAPTPSCLFSLRGRAQGRGRAFTHTHARARTYGGARLTHDDASAASPARTERRNPVAPEDYIETHPRGLGNASD